MQYKPIIFFLILSAYTFDMKEGIYFLLSFYFSIANIVLSRIFKKMNTTMFFIKINAICISISSFLFNQGFITETLWKDFYTVHHGMIFYLMFILLFSSSKKCIYVSLWFHILADVSSWYLEDRKFLLYFLSSNILVPFFFKEVQAVTEGIFNILFLFIFFNNSGYLFIEQKFSSIELFFCLEIYFKLYFTFDVYANRIVERRKRYQQEKINKEIEEELKQIVV